jgi:ATP-dependent DNA helicase PIF1
METKSNIPYGRTLSDNTDTIQPNLRLTQKQMEAYNSIKKGQNVFLTGSAGTGKTSVIKSYVKEYGFKRRIAVTSTTGTSALLLGGTTIHSYLAILLGKESLSQLYNRISSRPFTLSKWTKLDCLIIDEISMLDPDLFDKLENLARLLRKNDKPFGGIQLVLSGDFLQLPCVGTDNFCFESKSWNRCIDKTFVFTEIIRQADIEFQTCLNFLRFGVVNENVINTLNPRIGVELINEFNIKPTKLYSRNIEVDALNDYELDLLASDGREFYEYNREIKKIKSNLTDQYIERAKKNCNAPENLQLCVGAQVMLLINMDMEAGLCNGSRGIVIDIIEDIPVVQFLNGVSRTISHYTWNIQEGNETLMKIIQIPLRVAYATTIHKSQGSSLDYVEIDLSDIFDYGQAYVALSRVKRLEGLSIIDIDYDKIVAHPVAVHFYQSQTNSEE